MVSAFGGRNGSLVCKSSSLSLTSVSKHSIQKTPRALLIGCTGFIYFASYTYFTSTYFPWMPNAGKCAGEEFAAFSGMVIITSYLVLFISFYIATYNKTAKAGRPRRNTGKQSLIDMRNMEIPPVGQSPSANSSSNGNATTTGRSNGPVTRSRKA